MTVVLVAVNARYTHIALSLRYLRTALKAEAGVEALVREYVINQDRLEILQDIARAKPDILMISVYVWNSRLVASLLPDIRSLNPRCKIILGGPEVSYSAEDWLRKHAEIDLVVCGPGETAVAELARGNFDLASYPAKVLHADPCDFTLVPLPYLPEDRPSFSERYVYYESSRGCPFSCSYCLSSVEGHALQMKDAGVACAELDELMLGNPILLKFIDRTFNAEPRRARAIWSHLAERHGGSRARFHFEVHPGLLSEADFRLLAEVPRGLFQFEIGIQTVSARTRAAVARGGDWEAEKAGVSRIVAMGNIHVHVDLIAGLPYEGVAEIAKTFDEVVSLGADHVQMGFLKGLPGTALRETFDNKGMTFMRDAPYEILRSEWLDNEQLSFLKRVSELLENTGNTHKYDALLSAQAGRLGGWFRAYSSLSGFCESAGFDVRTRNEVKVRPLLEAWAAALP